MVKPKQENLFLTILFLFIIFTKLVAARTSRLSRTWTPMARPSVARSPMARSPMARSQMVREWEWDFFEKFSHTGNSDSLVSDARCRQNTSSHAHFSQSCQSSQCSALVSQLLALVNTFSHVHTCVCLKTETCCLCALAPKSLIFTPCSSNLFWTIPTSHHSARHHGLTSMLLTGTRTHPCAAPPEGCRLAIWPTPLLTQDVSPTSASTSQWAHADQLPLEEKQVQLREWLDDHSRGLWEFRRFLQRLTASGSQQPVPANVVIPCPSPDMSSRTRKLLRSN